MTKEQLYGQMESKSNDTVNLGDREENYRKLHEMMIEGFALFEIINGEQGRPFGYKLVETNPAFERLSGIKYTDLRGRQIQDIFPDTGLRWIESFSKVVKTGNPLNLESYCSEQDRWYRISAFRSGLRNLAVCFVDITAQTRMKNMNETLEKRIAERTFQSQEKTERLRALAAQLGRTEQRERKRLARFLHDSIQPLVVAARMQLWEIKRKSDTQRPRVEKIEGILQEVLVALRTLSINLSPPALQSGLINGLKWLVEQMNEKHQIHINLFVDEKAEPMSEETRFLLFGCVRELLLNVVKHAGVMEADVYGRLTTDRRIELVVSDQGKGFDPGLLTGRQSTRMTFGLFNIQERLEDINGHLLIETSPDKGTKVILSVPIGEAEMLEGRNSDSSSNPEDEKRIEIRNKEKMIRVLIVDDHEILREGLREMFRYESDIDIIGEAADGPQAIELAEKLKPDIIVMDVNLGEMDGIEATRRILLRHPRIKVIGLSMDMDKNVAEAMRNAGAVAYLSKESPSETLVTTVRASG